MLRRFLSGWLGALVLTAAACSNSGSSPSVPSVTSGAGMAATGATIAGTVSFGGTSRRVSAQGASAAGSGLTVTVAGTSISSLVDSTGHFLLNSVPGGNIQLRFTGAGIDARIAITGVVESEQIQLAVAVSGATATIITIERNPPASTDVELKGTVSTVSVGCPTPTFVVNGTTITTNLATQFKKGTCSSLRAGIKVEVEGARQANGNVLALEVEIQDLEGRD